MDHIFFSLYEKMPPAAAFLQFQLLIFALLIGNTAAGLAGRLAGGLALTAAAILGAFAQVAGLKGLDVFHNFTFYNIFKWYYFITLLFSCQSYFSYFSHFFSS